VTPDLNTLLAALYVEIDDHVIRSHPATAGRPQADAGCGAAVPGAGAAERLQQASAAADVSHPAEPPAPELPKHPGYHKRLKAAVPLLAAVVDHLARQPPSWLRHSDQPFGRASADRCRCSGSHAERRLLARRVPTSASYRA
jgi:hypothetical protein